MVAQVRTREAIRELVRHDILRHRVCKPPRRQTHGSPSHDGELAGLATRDCASTKQDIPARSNETASQMCRALEIEPNTFGEKNANAWVTGS